EEVLRASHPSVAEIDPAVSEDQGLDHAVHGEEPVHALLRRPFPGRSAAVEPAVEIPGYFTGRDDAVLDGRLEPHRLERAHQPETLRNRRHDPPSIVLVSAPGEGRARPRPRGLARAQGG